LNDLNYWNGLNRAAEREMADYDVAIIGSGLGGLTEVRALNVATGQESQIDLKGVFRLCGAGAEHRVSQRHHTVKRYGPLPTDVWMRTELPGLYAVGDIRQDSPAQAITSAGEGAVATMAAHRYIRETFA
jgi:thioredoxin reductase (NADPH)